MSSDRKKPQNRPGKKGIYILPNLFTSASLFSGFYAIIAAIHGNFETAAIAILISCVLDALDGKIARITHSTSLFGAEFDSLSDLVAFGVAPAILAFQWALEPFGRLGWLACFMYVICGALRLARFNVQKSGVDSRYFNGLPIPAAASFIASLVLFSSEAGVLSVGSRHIIIIVLVYILSFFMVSTISYMSFKKFELKRQKPFNVLVSIILGLVVVAYKPKIMLFFILSLYILSGPAVTWHRVREKRNEKKTVIENSVTVEKE